MTDVGLFSFFMWVSSFPISICTSSSACFWHFVDYKMIVLHVLIFRSLIVFHLSTFPLCDRSILISTALLYNLRSGMHIHFKNHCKDTLLLFFFLWASQSLYILKFELLGMLQGKLSIHYNILIKLYQKKVFPFSIEVSWYFCWNQSV